MRSQYRVAQREDGSLVDEHVLIAERAYGGRLPKGTQVHHVDGNKRNNASGNLVICQDAAYHWLLHRRTNALRAGRDPNANEEHCSSCDQWWPRERFHLRRHGAGAGRPMGHCKWCEREHQWRRKPLRGRGRLGNAKLNEFQVWQIKRRVGIDSDIALAKEFGVCRETVQLIRLGKHWSFVNPEAAMADTTEF